MTRYRIDGDGTSVSIEVSEARGEQDQLLAAFGECQEGRCSCPTDEYQKLASIDVQTSADVIRLQLESKPGETIDTSQIAACLEYTMATVTQRRGL